jgi:hypothetical protein
VREVLVGGEGEAGIVERLAAYFAKMRAT